MPKVISVEEMKAIEAEGNARGLSYEEMMENAGGGLADLVQIAHSQEDNQIVLGLIGSGNNGGDTLIALEHLALAGWDTTAYLTSKRSTDDPLIERLVQAEGAVVRMDEDKDFQHLSDQLDRVSVVLDGVLGTGFHLPLKGETAKVLGFVKDNVSKREPAVQVIAVDCPSGVDCNSGAAADEVIPADITVCMQDIKIGLLNVPAVSLVGEIQVVDIGLPDDFAGVSSANEVATSEMVHQLLPKRPRDSHKGTFGTALIAAGSVNYSGAALLAGRAAYRVGTGLVSMAVPYPLHAALAGQFPEATWLLLPHEVGVISKDADQVLCKNLGRATALLLGPGWGMEETTFQFVSELFDPSGTKKGHSIGFVHPAEDESAVATKFPPTVIDADGLKLIARIPEWSKKLPPNTILTPHPGEMAILTGKTIQEIQGDRINTARHFAMEWGHIVVLKGAYTVVAEPQGSTTLIPIATPALARAGTGDVLAGMIVGLLAQKVPAYQAAVLGAWLHGQSGIIAEELVGNAASVMAGDVLDAIATALTMMMEEE